jgi:hypothetical protein
MKIIFLLTVLLNYDLAYSYAEKLSNIDKFKSAKQLEQVKIESGGVVILEQFQKEENIGDYFLVSYECSKKKDKLKCKLVRLDGKKK